MFVCTTTQARRGSVALGGLLLAALFSSADLASPTTAAAQASAAHQVLLGRLDVGFGTAIGARAGETVPRIVSPEAALLGKVEDGPAGEQARGDGAERRAFANPKPRGGEEALLGRGGIAS